MIKVVFDDKHFEQDPRTFAIMYMIIVIKLFSNIAVRSVKGWFFVLGNPEVTFRRIPNGKLAITFLVDRTTLSINRRSVSLQLLLVLLVALFATVRFHSCSQDVGHEGCCCCCWRIVDESTAVVLGCLLGFSSPWWWWW